MEGMLIFAIAAPIGLRMFFLPDTSAWYATEMAVMGIDDEELRAETKRFEFVVEDVKRYFGQWDMYDPVVWAILRVVEAQNDFAHAIDVAVNLGLDQSQLEAAIEERRKAVAALQKAIEREPRGFQ
jgi:hypothetical protein